LQSIVSLTIIILDRLMHRSAMLVLEGKRYFLKEGAALIVFTPKAS